MLENLILLLITIVSLLFVGLLWLRHSLLHALSEVQHQERVLQNDFDKRRDTVPYLLESVREAEEPSDSWRRLAEDRHAFHEMIHFDLEKELAFEHVLRGFIQNTHVKNVHFLDAKKDIEELSALIEKEKQTFASAKAAFNAKRGEFPYSLATGVFGFKSLN